MNPLDRDEKANLLDRLSSASSSEPHAEVSAAEESTPNGSAKEPSEGGIRQASIKPSAKTNMVAREVHVRVTGLQLGKPASLRELFTEESSSVLVHENGGVIQLSASVTRGQLLLLANVESKVELVAQVKRTYQPMNRCVELEFAEPAPRFWGTDFSAATALLPKDAKQAEAVAMFSAAGAIDDAGDPLSAPTAEEVQALKRDVNVLRAKAAGVELPAESPAVEHDFVPVQPTPTPVRLIPGPLELTPAEEGQLPTPALDFTVPVLKPKGLFIARGKFTPGAKLRIAMLVTALVLTAAGGVWFKRWSAARSAAREAFSSGAAVSASVTTSPQSGSRETPKENVKFSTSKMAIEAPPISEPTPNPVEKSSPAQPVARPLPASDSVESPVIEKAPAAATVAANARFRPAAPVNPVAVPVISPAKDVIVPPKLIKSVVAVASLDDLRDFETGKVMIDAVVGTEGEVHLITVISGPPSLRAPAVEAVKQYRYEPATRNGQPIPEHVHITVRFRFES